MSSDEIVWVRSSKCSGGSCVEVADDGGQVLLRDGKNPDQPALSLDRAVWNGFLAGIKDGQFDL